MKIKELEKRLQHEPDNLGLRVTVAGMMQEAGRGSEAVELYRSVALAYRDQGRTQQAIAVCRSILDIAPSDRACIQLLAQLLAPSDDPARRSSQETPLPKPIPHHVADPTSQPVRLTPPVPTPTDPTERDDLPVVEGAATRPGEQERPSTAGLAQAARTISGLFTNEAARAPVDLSDELETRQRPRIKPEELRKITQPPPTVPVRKVDLDERPTPVPTGDTDNEDELTEPRERVERDRDK